MRLLYSEEPFPLGTAGAVRRALPKLAESTILLLNGDSYCAVDIAAFREFHERMNAQASLALAQVPSASRYGGVLAEPSGRVKRFAEKTSARSEWINAGIYLLERSLLEQIPVGQPLSLERDMFPSWVEGGLVYGFRCSGRFLDIGTPEAYAEAAFFFPAQRARPPLSAHEAA
jgi:NDP-sugar pyrophosphorylase family protein